MSKRLAGEHTRTAFLQKVCAKRLERQVDPIIRVASRRAHMPPVWKIVRHGVVVKRPNSAGTKPIRSASRVEHMSTTRVDPM